MVVLEVTSENPAEMAAVEDDNVVEAFAADAADDALAVWRLPRALGSREDLRDPHRHHSPAELGAADAVAVAEQVGFVRDTHRSALRSPASPAGWVSSLFRGADLATVDGRIERALALLRPSGSARGGPRGARRLAPAAPPELR